LIADATLRTTFTLSQVYKKLELQPPFEVDQNEIHLFILEIERVVIICLPGRLILPPPV
jgi:hypothetical protein